MRWKCRALCSTHWFKMVTFYTSKRATGCYANVDKIHFSVLCGKAARAQVVL